MSPVVFTIFPSRFRLVLYVAIIIFIAVGSLFFDAYQYLYPGAFRNFFLVDTTPAPIGTEQSFIETEDHVRLRVWRDFCPSLDRSGPTVVIFGGDDGDIRNQSGLATYFIQQKFNVIRFDYRGYGGSHGFPTQSGIEQDVSAVAKLARSIPSENVNVWGASFGTYPALLLATQVTVNSVTLIAPYVDFKSVDLYEYRFPWLVKLWWPEYSTIKIAKDLKGNPSVRIYYGENDTLIPGWQAIALANAIPNTPSIEKQVIEVKGATHRSIISQVMKNYY